MNKSISNLDFLKMASIALKEADNLSYRSRGNRIKMGMYFSKTREGRFWIKTIPYGYKKRWTEGHFRLVQVKAEVAAIKAIYTLFLDGVPLRDILAIVQHNRCPINGVNALKRILVNPLYSGYQYVSAIDDLPGGYFPANIQGIISHDDWQTAQQKLIANNYIKSKIN